MVEKPSEAIFDRHRYGGPEEAHVVARRFGHEVKLDLPSGPVVEP
jgi:hypothetical protein